MTLGPPLGLSNATAGTSLAVYLAAARAGLGASVFLPRKRFASFRGSVLGVVCWRRHKESEPRATKILSLISRKLTRRWKPPSMLDWRFSLSRPACSSFIRSYCWSHGESSLRLRFTPASKKCKGGWAVAEVLRRRSARWYFWRS